MLHALSIAGPLSQTYPEELALLSTYAAGAGIAVEIGSFQGVSSALIAAAMRDDGILYCVDPWPERNGRSEPNLAIFRRHIRRRGLGGKIAILRGTSRVMAERLPRAVDFLFIDGDHSKAAIEFDWLLARDIVRAGGHVCLHDALVPASEPWRTLGSAACFGEVIARDPDFALVDSRHTMAVMRRR